MAPAKLKYVATVTPVREVVLRGTADLGFWREQLARDNLAPVEHAGHAQLLIGATDMRYMGIRARELTVSVVARPTSATAPGDGYFLPQAFNSSRLFAWLERVWFKTPYRHAGVETVATPPARIRLTLSGRVALAATMSGADRALVRSGSEAWQGPIYLPRPTGAAGPAETVFYADLRGDTAAYPFLPSDEFEIVSDPTAPILDWLLASRFTPREWSLRTAATHARSKTFRRDAAVRL